MTVLRQHGGDGRVVPEVMASALTRDFRLGRPLATEFIALANGLANDSGWACSFTCARRPADQPGTSDHARASPAASRIMAIDMYEHAYHLDFGANADAYIAAFMRNIEWNAVQGRYEGALKVAPPGGSSRSSSATCRPLPSRKWRPCSRQGTRADHRCAASALHDQAQDIMKAPCGVIPNA